jgi:hypothetical protein
MPSLWKGSGTSAAPPAVDAKAGLRGEVIAELGRCHSGVAGAIVLVGGVEVPHGMLMSARCGSNPCGTTMA